MKKTSVFTRFFVFFNAVLFACVSLFISSNSYSVTCPAGYKPQNNVFATEQYCVSQDGHGYEHTGGSYTNSSISEGNGTWESFFKTFTVKGRAYCSTSKPNPTTAKGDKCPTILRRATADTISDNLGTQCWCQATEHQQASSTSNAWTAPFQKIYAKYVYLKDMGDSCERSCAAYCSFMATNLVLDGSASNPVFGENLRASIYDSLLECVPVENKITYISDGEIIDYQYYSDSVKLKDDFVKIGFDLKGWCETENCSNPLAPGSVNTTWSGEKTLYAKWELSTCGEGVKSEYVDGVLTCTTECEDGYEKQINPFSSKYYDYASNDYNYCNFTGDVYEKYDTGWYVEFQNVHAIRGDFYCSTTQPPSATSITDEICKKKLYPMLEEINTEDVGDYCWCKATEYEQLHASSMLSAGTKIPLDSKYVYTKKLYDCQRKCPEMCSNIRQDSAFEGVKSKELRISMYRSVKQCVKGDYYLVYKDGYTTLETVHNYPSTITLITAPHKAGFIFAGWCEDLSNCNEPLTGTQTGMFGNKTLYAKYIAEQFNITYEVAHGVLPKNAPMTYAVDTTTQLQPIATDGFVFEGWYDNDQFVGDPIESLPASSSQTGPVTLYARQSVDDSSGESGSEPDPVPDEPTIISCDTGYDVNTSSDRELNPATSGVGEAYKSFDGNTTSLNDFLPDIGKGASSNGQWGIYFINPETKVYGMSSCNTYDGNKASDAMVYSTKNALEMSDSTAGANCWCKMTKFIKNNNTVNTDNDDALWVYIDTLNASGGNDATSVCQNSCAAKCADATLSNQFFRSQLFNKYSICKAKMYDINYFNDGTKISAASLGMPEQYTVAYKNIELPIDFDIQKSNYTFDTWLDENNEPINEIITQNGGDRSVYIGWAPNESHINFESTVPGSGISDISGSMESKTVHYNETNIKIPENAFIAPGYTFKEWLCSATKNDNENYTKTYNNGGTIVKYEYTGDMTCYAIWNVINYNIRYGSTVALDDTWLNEQPKEFLVNTEDILIPNPTPANDQYIFRGWCINQEDDCSDEQLQTDYVITKGTTNDMYLLAYWTPKTYTITYHKDVDDVISDVEPTSYNYNDGVDSLPTKYDLDDSVKPHYNFVGWFDNPDLNGDAITMITDTEFGDKDLWAKWEPKQYTVKYYLDSAKENLFKEVNYTVEDANISDLPTPTKNQFSFESWMSEDDEPVDTIITSTGSDIELYATWVRTSCDENYYLEGETCYACPDNYPLSNGTDKNACYAICPETPVCTENSTNCAYNEYVDDNLRNYYNKNMMPCGVTYDCESHYTMSDLMCIPEVYTITYHDKETQITDLSEEYYTYTYTQGLSLPTAQKPHYSFVDWYDNPRFEGRPITELSDTDYGNKELWAKWRADELHIEFEHGTAGKRTTGFEGVMVDQFVSYDEENVVLSGNSFEIPGYEFNGWICTATDKDDNPYIGSYADNGIIDKYEYSIMICEAQWKPKNYTLYYDCNGWEFADEQAESVTVTYDKPYVLNSGICKDKPNYSLLSWDCDNDLDTDVDTWNVAFDSHCIAHWKYNVFNIEYRDQDGTIMEDIYPKSYVAAGNTLIPIGEKPTKEHFEFIGWCDNADLTGDCPEKMIIKAGSNTDKVFYAKWVATECPESQYLDSTVCKPCPEGYVSNAWEATKASDCYFDWACDDTCPEGGTCSPVSGAYSGRVYYGQDPDYSCEINLECERGYTPIYERRECMLNKYTINYHNVNRAKTVYTVKDSGFSVVPPVRDGYVFYGWCVDNETCDDTEMTMTFTVDPETMPKLANIDLYAQWKENVIISDFVCESERYLNINGVKACLSDTKPGRPALAFTDKNGTHYLKMTKRPRGTEGLNINKDSNKKLNIWYHENVYNVHDASVERR